MEKIRYNKGFFFLIYSSILNYFLLKKSRGKIFYLLPAGVYDNENNFYASTFTLRQKLIKKGFKIGDALRINDFRLLNYLKDITLFFSPVGNIKSSKISATVTDARELTIQEMLEEVSKFKYDKSKTPYENYLEATVVSLFIQSMNNSKSLLGGIWGSGGVKVSYEDIRKDTYAHFVWNINSKNEIIIKLRKILYQYPEEMRTMTDMLELTSFNPRHSEYENFLEYRILQIKFKIILQEIILHSYYMSAKDKEYYDKYFRTVKEHLTTYT